MSISKVIAAIGALLVAATSALVLQELPHQDGLRYTRRGDPLGCLDLKSEENFLWGAADESQAALGNLTVFMPGEAENILSMERFSDMLTSVDCTQSTIDMAFKDDDTFAYAQTVWDWVNGEDNSSFIMVAGKGACGWNEDHRQPFRITTLAFDEAANVAHLTAEAVDWAQAIHTYNLNVGGFTPEHLQKRAFGEIDYNKDLNIDFNHKFPVDTVSLPISDGVDASLDLSNCSTAGSFAFQFSLETIFLIPKKAEMSVHPQGVTLTIAPSLTLSGNVSEPLTGDLQLARINLAGIQIPAGILDIGPDVVLSVGATVGPLHGEATVEAGVVYSLDDAAVASVDVMGFEAQQSGWTPQVATTPLKVQAELDGKVKAFVKAELELAAKAFGVGFDMGIGLAPYLAADLATVTAESGSCGTSDGLAIDPSYGVDLILDAHTPFDSEDDPLFEITLFSLDLPLDGTCLPFDSTEGVPAKVSSTALSAAQSTSSVATSSATASPPALSMPSSTLSSMSTLVASASQESTGYSSFASSSSSLSIFSASSSIAPTVSALYSPSPPAYGYTAVTTLSTAISKTSAGSLVPSPTAAAAPQYGKGNYGYGFY